MSVKFMLTYFVLFCTGLLSIVICARMVKAFRFKYLSHYLFFLITINITALYGDVPQDFGLFLGVDSQQAIRFGGLLGALLGTPMLLISIYMFALLITGLLEQKLSRAFKIGYFVFSGFVFMVSILLIFNYSVTQKNKILMIFLGYSMKVFFVIFLTIAAYLFIKSRVLPDGYKRKVLRVFGIFYAVNFSLVLFFSLRLQPIVYLSQNLLLFFFFTLHLFPLLYLYRFLKQRQTEFLPPAPGEIGDDLTPVLAAHNISKRETEIIRLLLKGKTNKEIEDELFISINTVRNHVYNIYRKLGVKNRVELVNFITNSARGA